MEPNPEQELLQRVKEQFAIAGQWPSVEFRNNYSKNRLDKKYCLLTHSIETFEQLKTLERIQQCVMLNQIVFYLTTQYKANRLRGNLASYIKLQTQILDYVSTIKSKPDITDIELFILNDM